MPKAVADLRLFELPAEFQELDDRISELESWQQPSADASEEDRLADKLEFEALETWILERLDSLRGRADQLGEIYHGWLRRLKLQAEMAREEARRVQKIAQIREKRFERIKSFVLDTMEQSNLPKLEGPSWKLRVQKNGGVLPLYHDEVTPIPPSLAVDLIIDPAYLVEVVSRYAANGDSMREHELTDLGILANFCDTTHDIKPDFTKVRAAIKANNGEVPPGFSAGDRGTHLRVE